MPEMLSDILSLTLTLATLAAVIFLFRKGAANRAIRRGKRTIDE